jgi:hypothetical protein
MHPSQEILFRALRLPARQALRINLPDGKPRRRKEEAFPSLRAQRSNPAYAELGLPRFARNDGLALRTFASSRKPNLSLWSNA